MESEHFMFVNKLDAVSSSASQSDATSTNTSTTSDEEGVVLATDRPKKRAGRRVFKETRHPIYRGVRRKNGDKWVCEVRKPNNKTRIWLGTYPTPEMAARAHDVAALALRGKSACLNFADSTWRLPVPSSLDAKEIRRAATEAAEMFRVRNLMLEDGCSSEEASTTTSSSIISSCQKISGSEINYDVGFMDEEALLDMPRLLEEMAQGLLLSPPFNYANNGGGLISNFDDVLGLSDGDFSLWTY